MSDKSNRNDLNSEKVHADKKARRRELYKLTQSNKKDAYLAGRRANSAIENNASIGASSSTTTLSTHEQTLITGKKQLLPLIPVQHKLLGKTFTIQIKKLFAKNKDASSAKLFIMSIIEKDIASNLPLPVTAPTTPESSKRKLKQIMTKED